MTHPDPNVQREGDLDSRIPHVFEVMTGTPWAAAHPGTRANLATNLVRMLDVADQHDPARQRLAQLESLLSNLDRNEHGRHEGDVDASDPTGTSQGNPHMGEDRVIGYRIGGHLHHPIRIPLRGEPWDTGR